MLCQLQPTPCCSWLQLYQTRIASPVSFHVQVNSWFTSCSFPHSADSCHLQSAPFFHTFSSCPIQLELSHELRWFFFGYQCCLWGNCSLVAQFVFLSFRQSWKILCSNCSGHMVKVAVMESIALKAAMVLPSLLLQKPQNLLITKSG